MVNRQPSRPEPSRRRPVLFGLLIVVSVAVIGAGLWQLAENRRVLSAQAAPAAVDVRPAPGFRLATTDGGELGLSDLRGKVVLINFWATWCPPCKAEMPDLNTLQRKYAAEHEFVVLGINVEESPTAVAAFGEAYGLTFPLLLDTKGAVSNDIYNVRSLPTSIIVDRKGQVRDMWIGQIAQPAMLARLERVW